MGCDLWLVYVATLCLAGRALLALEWDGTGAIIAVVADVAWPAVELELAEERSESWRDVWRRVSFGVLPDGDPVEGNKRIQSRVLYR